MCSPPLAKQNLSDTSGLKATTQIVQVAVTDCTGTSPTVFFSLKLKDDGDLVLKCSFHLLQVKFMKN